MKAFIEIHTDALLERKAKLEQAIKNNEPVKARKITRSGTQWYIRDRQSIEEEISNIESELQRRKEEDVEEDKLVKEGKLTKTYGPAAIDFLKSKVAERLFEDNKHFIHVGKKKLESDKKRQDTMMEKNTACPEDIFQVKELSDAIKGKSKADIGLYLVHGPIDFKLPEYSTKSLKEAFEKTLNITIAIRTWQHWTSTKYSKPTRLKKTAYARKFSKK